MGNTEKRANDMSYSELLVRDMEETGYDSDIISRALANNSISAKPSNEKPENQFFVAGELWRRGHFAAVTLGNCINTDILCSNSEGTRFVHIQVRTFVPGDIACIVGLIGEIDFGENFFWILGGIPQPYQNCGFEYYIIPSREMAKHVTAAHKIWVKVHRNSGERIVELPPHKPLRSGWDISPYKDRWDLIEEILWA